MSEPTMGEFLGHLELLVGRIERVFGFAPCARCGALKAEHKWLGGFGEVREILGRLHDYRLPGSVLDREDQDFYTRNFDH